MKWRWPRCAFGGRISLTLKLIAIYLAISFLGVYFVASAMQHAFREGYRENIRPHLAQYVRYVRNDLGSPPQLENAQRLSQDLPLEIYFKSPQAQWATDGGQFPDLQDIHFGHRARRHGLPIRWGHRDGDNIAMIRTPAYTLLFITPDNDDHWRPVMLLPLLVVAVIFIALYYLTQRLFSPLHTIRRAVNAFGEGDLERRLTLNRRDELNDVANSFNQMADRIQQMLDSKRELLLAISHELRSPLTRAKLATAMLDNPEQRSEIDTELAEMAALVNELLESERLNAGHSALNTDNTDLIDLLRKCVDQTGNAIATDLPTEPVFISIDSTRIRLAVKNLLDNAIKYTPDNEKQPRLTLREQADSLSVNVRDWGRGIAAEHLAHISEPFYRADTARQRATGGYGLGLYLSRKIVEAHGGSFHIESTVGKGTTVSLHLPKSSA